MSEHYPLTHQRRADTTSHDAWLGESLLYVLRERLGLPGAKARCEQGECGSCSVLVDGSLVCSCLVLAASVVEQRDHDRRGPHRPTARSATCSSAFVDEGAVQCGFCTPGLVMAVHDLLDRVPDARPLAIREAMSGNLCRCTGYGRILAAVRDRGPRRASVTDTCVTDTETTGLETRVVSDRAVLGASPTRPDGDPEGAGRFAFAVRPLGRGDGVGPARCGRRIRTPASVASTSAPRGASPASR